ncbi:MAG TPA: hypothetical protein VFB62_01850 [Polyangiaceae bacterium]|nr:hypothetical protein [Polyangiaceae bacterium]
MNLLHQVRIAYIAFRQRVRARLIARFRPQVRKSLRMRVDGAPDPKTLDSLGQERLKTHVRTRPDLT